MINIKCVFDNNPDKQGQYINDIIPICKPSSDLLDNLDLLLITCGEGDVIVEQLNSLGLSPETKIFVPDFFVCDGKDFDYIWSSVKELSAVYDLLEDEKSKAVFRNILNFKITHDPTLIKAIYDDFNDQYFDPELIKFDKDDVFIDCGSYIGDTIESYKAHSKDTFSKIYAIEVDTINFAVIKRNYAEDSRIIPLKYGVWDRDCDLSFDNIGSGSGRVSEAGSEVITAKAIDSIIGKENNVTDKESGVVKFIKMDIEGAEYNALMGARLTIERDKPTLMISVYHKKDDFIRIPLLIKSIEPKYKLYFRHYRKMSVQETICYAIPSKEK